MNISLDPNFWVDTREGYNSAIKNVPVVGIEGGIDCLPWLSIGFSVDTRQKYTYCKRQQPLDPTASGRTRFFNVDNTSYIFNVTLNRAADDCCKFYLYNCSLRPYIGAGLGWSFSSIYNFHTVLDTFQYNGDDTVNDVIAIMAPKSSRTLAWNMYAGLDLRVGQRTHFSIAYRFYDTKKFKSNNYFINVQSTFDGPTEWKPWPIHVSAHEIIFQLGVDF